MTQISTSKVAGVAVLAPHGALHVAKPVAYAVELPAASLTVSKVAGVAVMAPHGAVHVAKPVAAGVELRWPLSGMWYRTQAGDWVAITPYGCIGNARVTEEDDARITQEGDRRVLNGEGVWLLIAEAIAKRVASTWGRVYPMDTDPGL